MLVYKKSSSYRQLLLIVALVRPGDSCRHGCIRCYFGNASYLQCCFVVACKLHTVPATYTVTLVMHGASYYLATYSSVA